MRWDLFFPRISQARSSPTRHEFQRTLRNARCQAQAAQPRANAAWNSGCCQFHTSWSNIVHSNTEISCHGLRVAAFEWREDCVPAWPHSVSVLSVFSLCTRRVPSARFLFVRHAPEGSDTCVLIRWHPRLSLIIYRLFVPGMQNSVQIKPKN